MSSTQAFAMIFENANEPFLSKGIELPELNPGEVLVKNTYCTVCSSDLHTYYGRRNSCPHSILGHEIVGHITALPEGGVNDFYGNPLNIGDTITWTVYAYNPESKMAKRGIPQKSDGLYKYGHQTMKHDNELNGGFSTHCHLLPGTAIFKIPETLSLQEAAPLNCTHATIAAALRLAGKLNGRNVLVSGAGMLGLSACAMALSKGAAKVWATDVKSEKLDRAKMFGASHVFEASAPASEMLKTTDRYGGIDIIIETSGEPSAIEKATDLLSIGGTIILVGSVFTQRNISINAEKITRNLLTIKGLHNYIPEDLGEAVRFLSDNKEKYKYPFHTLVGREYPLYQLKEAFDQANSGLYYRVGINPVDEENLNSLLY